jgi:hypothetical protein
VLAYPLLRRFSVWLIRRYTTLTSVRMRGSLHVSRAAGHVDYEPGLVDDMDEYITVATFDKTTDAHIAMGRLAAEGIRALLFDDNMVQMDWLYSIALGGIKLRVVRADESLARQILSTDYSRDLDNIDVGQQEN